MSKSSGSRSGVFGRNSAGIVDVVQRRQADRLAKVAFIATACTLVPTVTVVASAVTEFPRALLVGVGGGLATAFVVGLVVFVWPVLRVLWWWAGEITLFAVLLGGYLLLSQALPWFGALLVLLGVLAVPAAVVPGVRRWVVAWAWCAISRHRLRTCFATFIRVNRYGSLPLILFARPTPAGERVWVVLRPGLALEDLTTEGNLARLAVGCWAHQVRLSRASRRFAPLVRVDITRRNPLSATVPNPLSHLVGDAPVPKPTVVGEPVGLDLADVPEEAQAAPVVPLPARANRPRPVRTPAAASEGPTSPAVVSRSGEDLSDWI